MAGLHGDFRSDLDNMGNMGGARGEGLEVLGMKGRLQAEHELAKGDEVVAKHLALKGRVSRPQCAE